MSFSSGSPAANLRVAAIQMNASDNKQANIEKALALIDQAAATGARLVALPEVWTFLGPQEANRENAEPIPGPLTEQLAERARALDVYLHAGSFYEIRPDEPKVLNTTVVFNPDGEIVAKYSKIHMFDVGLDGVARFEESATVKPGDELVTFDLDGITVGLAICYDVRFPEIFRILTLRGADVIMLPAAFTMTTGKDHWELLIRARAVENQVYMVAPGQYGADYAGNWTYGRSTIVDPWGVVLAVAPDTDTVISATIDRELQERIRRQIPSVANRMPDRYVWPDQPAFVP